MASPKKLELSPQDRQAIERALEKNYTRNTKVTAWYAAQLAAAGMVSGLSLERAKAGIPSLAASLGVPEWVFHDLPAQYSYYDFSGNGLLQMAETRKLVKHLLRQRCSALSGDVQGLDEVPYAQPHEQGYSVVRELGSGGQGTAYEAKNSEGKQVMLKFFDKDAGNASLGDVLDELETMKQLKNKHIAKVLEVFQDGKYIYLAGEIYTGGDWSTLGANVYYAGVTMSETWWRKIFKQALTGVDYLHKQAQMHCDIKEPNIMFKDKRYEKPSVVLIDFGLTRAFAEEQHAVSGSPGYVPPETWQNAVWHPLGDVFSMGVVMFQLVSGCVPSKTTPGVFTEGATDIAQVAQFTATRPLPFNKFPSSFPRLRELVDQMTQKNMWNRPRVQQVLKHDWFSATSDAPLPQPKLERLIESGRKAALSEKLFRVLEEENTLADLRYLRAHLNHYGQCQYVQADTFISILVSQGVDPVDAAEFVGLFTDGGWVPYAKVVDGAIKLKKQRDEQTLYELFTRVDVNGDGYITLQQAHELMHKKLAFGFLSEDDVDEIIADMQTHDGNVTCDAFIWAILKDGRMERRVMCGSDLDQHSLCNIGCSIS